MDVQIKIIKLFKSIYEKQDELSKLTDSELFNEFSNSEVHTIDIIGKNENINGVMISSSLGLTRGAISKIISTLKKKKLIDSYQNPGNKKEIYYKLTKKGRLVYYKHEKAHKDWEERELKFLDQVSNTEKDIISDFLKKYNSYLENLITERNNQHDNRSNNKSK